MKSFADAIDFKMELNPDVVERLLKQGQIDATGLKYTIKPIYINESPDYSPFRPYEHSKCSTYLFFIVIVH